MTHFGVVVFPGSNCDRDCYYAVSQELGAKVTYIWHDEPNLPKGLDVVILPGGFSYGDYLRTGAIAKFARIMPDIIRFAKTGGYVIGICNGFQILTEAGLLPGALLRNTSRKFICRDVYLKTEQYDSLFTRRLPLDRPLIVPIAHGEGRYFIPMDGLQALEDGGHVAFRYAKADGSVGADDNPNGSVNNIAGIFNDKHNVLGMMPHPERCAFNDRKALEILGG